MKRPELLASVLVGLWFLAMVGVFWVYMFKDLGRFTDEAWFDAVALQERLGALRADHRHTIQVVHLWNPACRCSRFNEAHVLDIMQAYQPLGVEFIVAVPSADEVGRARRLFPYAGEVMVYDGGHGLSTPAAVAFDAEGRLGYFGPYSDSALCSATGADGLLENVLDGLLGGASPDPWLNLAASGCFCDWPVESIRSL